MAPIRPKLQKRQMHSIRFLVISFLWVILAGTVLLALPISGKNGTSCGLVTALFTATSATCVTGLAVQDTLTFWSPFGQTVILLLIQIGGLGFAMVAAGFSMVFGKRIGQRHRRMLGDAFGTEGSSGAVRLARSVLAWTFTIEGLGALGLTVRFAKDYPFHIALRNGIFTAVSAFCNAGFDLQGTGPAGEYSLMEYNGDPAVTLLVAALIVLGGLGFFVISDLSALRERGHRIHLQTRVVLTVTGVLLAGGTVGFLLLEHNGVLAGMTPGRQLLSAFFQSTTARTAGFAMVPQENLGSGATALSCILMLIGGSPGSMAGGIKTTTAAVLLLSTVAALRGRERVVLFHRIIPDRMIRNAAALLVAVLLAASTGAFLISAWDGVLFSDALFETISALATVGLSRALTGSLCTASRLLLVLLMFCGRVGILSVGASAMMSADGRDKIEYPVGKLMIG